MNPSQPSSAVTEADLQAHVDGRLAPERALEVEAWLATRPDEARRIDDYRSQRQALRDLHAELLHQPVPERLRRAARRRGLAEAVRRHLGGLQAVLAWPQPRALAAGLALTLLGGLCGWGLRGGLPRGGDVGAGLMAAAPFAQRAMVAHTVYSVDQRRAVELDAAHEDQLVAWLSKRMGAPMRPPHLQALGYALEGGRLLPGGQGPVAQFMYRDPLGGRLTLYVSNEVGELDPHGGRATGFHLAQQGPVSTFYWVDGDFGYAISAQADRAALGRVSSEVYRQLAPAAAP